MNYMEDIENYGQDVADFTISPFETIEMLHLRTKLHEVFHQLTELEKRTLLLYDLKFLSHAEKMYEHLKSVYDFSLSQEPIEQWWWHLDKLVEGKILLTAQAVSSS